MIGSTISTYKVTAKLGEGGMGQVYRAHDTALGRDVALKILPPGFNEDTERLARFEREARLLASLNHPNIGAIYGVVPHENERVLVLELVGGADLSERLSRGPLPVDEAVRVARQVADALESAHDNGIVHRDLKPANIQINDDGVVKVLDFGLAKALDPAGDGSDPNLSKSPTMIASGTVEGVILGTAAYMSPEQARGRAIDRRADVWAFGCVLYELLTGRQAFSGETVSDTLASILKTEPDWNILPDDTPPPIRRLLERCLEKDARQRLRDIGEARIILEAVERGEAEEILATAAGEPARAGAGRMGWLVAAGFFVVAAALAAVLATRKAPEPELFTLSVMPPADSPVALQGYHPGPPALSPDGRRVAFSARSPEGTFLYVRDLHKTTPVRINGTSGAGYPFWSPDGKQIGFFANGMLMRVGADGSPPLTLCEARFGKGGTWNTEGTIVFAPTFNAGIFAVSENGGTARELTKVNTARGENSHRFPVFLPDGRRFLFLARGGGSNSSGGTPMNPATQGSYIMLASIDGGEPVAVAPSPAHFVLSAGHLLFMRGGVLMAQPFDADAGRLTGEAFPLVENIRYLPGAARGVFDASADGRLIYMGGSELPGYRLLLVDEAGREIKQVGDEGEYATPRISPDGKYIALEVYETLGGVNDIWVFEVARGVRTRLTFASGAESDPVWSPDSRYIAYTGTDTSNAQIYKKAMDGSAPAEVLYADHNDKFVTDWTADGRYIVYAQFDPDGDNDLWMVEADGDPAQKQPVELLASPFAEFEGVVSPDGNWLAYSSTESGGRVEVYVTTFPQPGSRYRLSSNGGSLPQWSVDGRSITYFSIEGRTMRVDLVLSGSGGLTASTPVELFDAVAGVGSYDVIPDGSGYVIIQPFDPMGSPPMTLITDWRQAFDQRHPR